MTITFSFPTDATLAGARDLNRMHRIAGQEDLGAKVEQLISLVNMLVGAAASAAGSGVSFSAFSGVTTVVSNFTA